VDARPAGADVDAEPVALVPPDYGGACISNILAGLHGRGDRRPSWIPEPVGDARQIVLLVLDGLGWEQLKARPLIAPTLCSMAGGAITSVAPSTTATALTSITTGLPPAAHEVVGYRVRVKGDAVLNVLRWRTAAGDARQDVDPTMFQTQPVFRGYAAPVVTRAEFAATGFTVAHLAGVRLNGWRMASSMPVQVAALLRAGEPFVYAYYDGVDKIAHEKGFGPYYDAELQAADRLVSDLASLLPPGAVLVVTADHGQVEVDDQTIALGPEVLAVTRLVSGEGRFRWLHARPGCAGRLAEVAHATFGHVAWVRTLDEIESAGWFGGPLTAAGRDRLGDVALIANQPVAFVDPADTGELALRCRHGSLTSAEMLVPLLAVAA
jgi:predicted AlkP superfamily pyrophosphatase or phosphodiesterase